MSRLNFKDIGDDWTPSAISIVDSPDHPLAVFEVYEDDEEFVKKSLNLEGENMVEEKHEEQIVSGPVSFFEKLLGKTSSVVVKSEEQPVEPPVKQPEKNNNENEVLEAIQKIDAKIDKIDERVTKLEKGEEQKEPKEGPEEDPEEDPKKNPTEGVVTKSSEVDPDKVTVTKSEKTLYERMGRNANGMTW